MRLSVLFALACLGQPLAAEPYQHGNVIFDVPSGWSVGSIDERGTLTLVSDLPNDECEFCYIYVSSGEQVGARADSWLTANAARFVEEDEIDPPVVEPMGAAELFNLKGRPGAMLGQKVDGDLQMLLAVQLFGRMELFGFEMPTYDEEELAANMSVFARDVQPMIEGARFVSEGATPLMPPAVPGDLQGLYWGFSPYWTMGIDGMMRMELDHSFLVFWPDGTFYDGTPPDGLAGFDAPAAQARGDMSWGTYRHDGAKLVLSFASGNTEELKATDDGFTRDEAALSLVEPLANGTKIDGSLSSMFYSGFTPGSGVEGGVSSSSYLLFKPDGTWTRDASGGAFGNFVDGGGSLTGGYATNSSNSQEGTYVVQDGLLIETENDGTERDRNLIFKAGGEIMVGSQTLAIGPDK